MQRWLSYRKIPALGIAETPSPHFHFAVGAEHSPELEIALRCGISACWRQVFLRDPDPSTLRWKSSEKPTMAIVKYLSKSSKGGRGVKGRAPWLTFTPYCKTGLPKRDVQRTTLTPAEASAVLGKYRLTFGAATALEVLRRTSANPVANAMPNPVATRPALSEQHTPVDCIHPAIRFLPIFLD